jgi:heme-degrading monooxygenase HmoA
MIIRIVRMDFREDALPSFLSMFEERKKMIRNFEGCTHLELWQDSKEKNIFFTYSIWDTEDHLNRYRYSELFKDTWAITKSCFAGKPQAWTVNQKLIVTP